MLSSRISLHTGPQPHCAPDGICYWVDMTPQNYGEAAQFCNSSRPGQLAIIDTQDKYDFLLNNVPAFTPADPYVWLNELS